MNKLCIRTFQVSYMYLHDWIKNVSLINEYYFYFSSSSFMKKIGHRSSLFLLQRFFFCKKSQTKYFTLLSINIIQSIMGYIHKPSNCICRLLPFQICKNEVNEKLKTFFFFCQNSMFY